MSDMTDNKNAIGGVIGALLEATLKIYEKVRDDNGRFARRLVVVLLAIVVLSVVCFLFNGWLKGVFGGAVLIAIMAALVHLYFDADGAALTRPGANVEVEATGHVTADQSPGFARLGSQNINVEARVPPSA